MKTGLTKKQKVTERYFFDDAATAEIYTHDTNLKKRLRNYADQYPDLCRLTDDDGHGGLRFEIEKHRLSIRLTAPYSESRRQATSTLAKHRGFHSNNTDDS